MTRGIKVALGARADVENAEELRLSDQSKQFKYRRVIHLTKTFPATPPGNENNITFSYNWKADNQDIDYIPAYEVCVKGYNERWGVPGVVSSQSYHPSTPSFPYFSRNQFIDEDTFGITLYVHNLTTTGGGVTFPTYDYPAHTVTVRLVLLFDPLEEV